MKTITNNKKEMDRLRISCLCICIIILKLDHSTISVSALHLNLVFHSFPSRSGVSIGDAQFKDLANEDLTDCVYSADEAHGLYTLKHYPVMYNGQPLYGWLNLKITKKDDGVTQNMRWTLGQAQTINVGQSYQDAIIPGEFLLTQFDEQNAPTCVTKHDSSYPKIVKKNYAPGMYVADPNPTVPYGFSYAASGTSNSGPTGMTLNWRMNFPFCGIFNNQRTLYFHMYIASQTTRNCNYQYPKNGNIIFQEYVSGASDPDPPKKAQLECTKSLGELQTGNNLPKWIEKVGEPNVKSNAEFFVNSQCLANRPQTSAYQGQQFIGRCQFYSSSFPIPSTPNAVGYDKQHFCQALNNAFWIKLPEQGDIIKNNTKAVCDLPKTCKNLNDDLVKNGISANSGIGKRVFSYRRGHGLFMIIGTLFFMTVSHFGAHFYKETFFNKRILNFHIWYTIHVNGSLMAFLAFFAGTFAGIAARLFFGYSRHVTGQIHVVLGWITIAVFLLVFVSSGFRMKSPTPRLISILLHYLGGGFSYFLCILCLVTSCYIPASPSGRSDVHNNGFVFEYFFLVPLIAWIIFDIAISVVMNICMLRSDKKMKFKKKRKWACFPVCGVAIPMLRPYSKKDLDGAKCRKLLLLVYFLVASLMTIALVVVEMTSPTDGRYFGLMTGTHEKDGTLTLGDVYIDDADSAD